MRIGRHALSVWWTIKYFTDNTSSCHYSKKKVAI